MNNLLIWIFSGIMFYIKMKANHKHMNTIKSKISSPRSVVWASLSLFLQLVECSFHPRPSGCREITLLICEEWTCKWPRTLVIVLWQIVLQIRQNVYCIAVWTSSTITSKTFTFASSGGTGVLCCDTFFQTMLSIFFKISDDVFKLLMYIQKHKKYL